MSFCPSVFERSPRLGFSEYQKMVLVNVDQWPKVHLVSNVAPELKKAKIRLIWPRVVSNCFRSFTRGLNAKSASLKSQSVNLVNWKAQLQSQDFLTFWYYFCIENYRNKFQSLNFQEMGKMTLNQQMSMNLSENSCQRKPKQ